MDEIFTGIAVGIGEYFIERDARRNEQLVKIIGEIRRESCVDRIIHMVVCC